MTDSEQDHSFTIYIDNNVHIIGSFDLDLIDQIRHDIKFQLNQLVVAEFEKYGNNNITQKLVEYIEKHINHNYLRRHIDVKLIK